MHDDYYLHTLYPLQNRVLDIVAVADNQFYLTGGTALSRAYLNHRYSDDLDFFLNSDDTYKKQTESVYKALVEAGFNLERAVMQDGFSRLFIHEKSCSLKIDFVNDVEFRAGTVQKTELFVRTDTMRNILSNKITALSRLEVKDVADILHICQTMNFHWRSVFEEAEKKDLWVNPVEVARVLEEFPAEHIDKVAWISEPPSPAQVAIQISQVINDILQGKSNSLAE